MDGLNGIVICHTGNIRSLSLYNPNRKDFPAALKIVQTSLAHRFPMTPAVISRSQAFSWTFPGLHKLRLAQERHLYDEGDWCGHKVRLESFILRHPLLHTISFGPERVTHGNEVTGLPFRFLNDALLQLVAITSLFITDIVLVRDQVFNEWYIDTMSVDLLASLADSKSGLTESLLKCLHKIVPAFTGKVIVDSIDISTVSSAPFYLSLHILIS